MAMDNFQIPFLLTVSNQLWIWVQHNAAEKPWFQSETPKVHIQALTTIGNSRFQNFVFSRESW